MTGYGPWGAHTRPVLLALRARAADTGCMDPVSA